MRQVARVVRLGAVHRAHRVQRRDLLRAPLLADRPVDQIASPQCVATHLALGHVHVAVPGEVPGGSQEAVALRQDVQHARTGLPRLGARVLIACPVLRAGLDSGLLTVVAAIRALVAATLPAAATAPAVAVLVLVPVCTAVLWALRSLNLRSLRLRTLTVLALALLTLSLLTLSLLALSLLTLSLLTLSLLALSLLTLSLLTLSLLTLSLLTLSLLTLSLLALSLLTLSL